MNYSHVHLIGANGVGLSAIGKLMLRRGTKVSGSDLYGGIFSEELEKMGASIFEDHKSEHLQEGIDLVLYSAAVPEDNPELIEAKKRGIKTMTYAQILGEVSKDYKTIAVAGTHGKSTTTAMLATILEDAGLDPTVIIGSRVPVWKYGNIRIGKSNLLVVEACEYKAHFLELEPYMIVLTNIDADHLDYYRDIKHIRDTFQKFVDKAENIVIVNGDDVESSKLHYKKSIIYDNSDITLSIPGKYNMENANAALAAALELEVTRNEVLDSLENFKGIWRRFERLGQWNGAEIISDYGHHPTAINRFLEAAREFFPDRRLVHIFQPHQHARTRDLFTDFVDVLGEADITIIPEIYAVAGRMQESDISSQDIVEAIRKKKPNAKIFYAKDLQNAEKLLEKYVENNDAVLFQGAGNIDELARSLSGIK